MCETVQHVIWDQTIKFNDHQYLLLYGMWLCMNHCMAYGTSGVTIIMGNGTAKQSNTVSTPTPVKATNKVSTLSCTY